MKPASSQIPPRPLESGRRGRLLPLLVLATLVLLFLAEPICRYRSSHYCFADFTQSFSLIDVEPGHDPENRMMGDPAVIYLPWAILNRDAVREGRFPAWNPYNGGGVPHLANYQSGVLSPYNLPFYLLDLKTALLASAFLKLYAIAAFTFLFLHARGLSRIASVAGASAFTFAGYHVVWLSGAITATAATLPASLFFAEVALARATAANRDERASSLAPPLAGLTLALTVGLLAGHPENLYFGGLLVTAYLGFRLWQLRASLGTKTSAALAGRFVACAGVAMLLSAIQLLPFLEYLLHSEVITGRSDLSAGSASRPAELWPLLFTPQVLGNAATRYGVVGIVDGSYVDAISPYVGGTVLLLAILSATLLRTSSTVRFFAIILGLWIVYMFDPLGLASGFRVIPGLSELPITRSYDIGLFCVACLAAWLVDALIRRRPDMPSVRTVSAAGIGTLALGVLGTRWLTSRYHEEIRAAAPESLELLKLDSAGFVGTFLLGLVAVLGMCIARTVTLRRAAGALSIGVVFLQTGFLLRDFNPTIEDELVYPVTPAMENLQGIVGSDRLLVAGLHRPLVASTNAVYGLVLPNHYDGIWIRRYDRLYRDRFGAGSFPRTPIRFDPESLQLFGIDYVLDRGPLVATELEDRRGLPLRSRALEPVGPKGVIQTFLSTSDRLQAVAVTASCRGDLEAGELRLRLEDVNAVPVVAEQAVPCTAIGTDPTWVPLVFPPLEGSAGARYRLVVRPNAWGSNAKVVLYESAGFTYRSGMLAVEGVRREGSLAFDFAYDLAGFEPLATFGDRRLFRFRSGRSRYYTVGRARVAEDDEEARRHLGERSIDPAREVLLTSPPPGAVHARGNDDPGRTEIVAEEPTRSELEVTRAEPGYLVIAKPHYPGWNATVDGRPRPLLRANYAFMAVEVPAGSHRVALRYEPASIRWGASFSLATALAGCAWLGWRIRRRRAARPLRRGFA